MKNKAKEVASTTKRVITNGEQFVQASALAVLAAFSIWALKQVHIHETLNAVVTVAVAITLIRAFVEYVKFLDR